MTTDGNRRYSQEEAGRILRRALERKETRALADEFSHDELVETAKEVGIEPAQLQQAIAEEEAERAGREEIAAWKARRRGAFKGAVTSYLMINVMLFAIDWFTAGGPWFFWVAIPWGIALLLGASRLGRDPSAEEIARMEERRRQRLRREERRRRMQETSEAFEDAVHHGVNLLVGTIGQGLKKLDEGRRRDEVKKLDDPRRR